MSPSPRRTTDTRERVLRAGLALWISTPPAELFAGLNVSRLSKEAGITRATFYTYWDTTQDYLDDLVEHLANSEPTGFDTEVAEIMERMAIGEGDLLTDYLQAGVLQIKAMAADPALRMRMGMLAKVDDPVVAEKLRVQFGEVEQRMTVRGGLVLARWGRTTRTPITVDHLTSLFNVLMEGWAVRHRLDPERYPPDVYAYACVALLFTLTSARDDPRDLDTVCSAMNWFSKDGDRIREAERQERSGSSVRPITIDSPRPRVTPLDIVVLTRRLVTRRPWQEVTIEEVAEAAGVDPDDVLRHFGSKHGLGIGVFLLLAEEAFAEIPPDLEPITDLREMLRIATDLMMRSVALAQSCVLVFAGMSESYAAGAVTWGPIPRLYAAIVAAQEAGQLSPDIDAEDFGGALLRTLLTHIRPLAAHPARREVSATELMLLGAGAPPRDAARETPTPHLRTTG